MPQLAPSLQAILTAELAAGNSVQEISEWPPACELLVVLRRQFGQAYPVAPTVAYRVLDDPHYWYAEYSFAAGQQLLACGFA
jgi:hypothetical protein